MGNTVVHTVPKHLSESYFVIAMGNKSARQRGVTHSPLNKQTNFSHKWGSLTSYASRGIQHEGLLPVRYSHQKCYEETIICSRILNILPVKYLSSLNSQFPGWGGEEAKDFSSKRDKGSLAGSLEEHSILDLGVVLSEPTLWGEINYRVCVKRERDFKKKLNMCLNLN